METKKQSDDNIDRAGLTPPELKQGLKQKEINNAGKEAAKDALRKKGHKVPRTGEALANLSVKDRNLIGKEAAKKALREEGYDIPKTPKASEKTTQRSRNLAGKEAAKKALKEAAKNAEESTDEA